MHIDLHITPYITPHIIPYVGALLVIIYYKLETSYPWKDTNCNSCQEGRSLFSSFLYRSKSSFRRFY
jgi:hypothetical protein